MPTRTKHSKPLARVRKQSGRERVRISGRQFWLGKAGSKTAKQNYEIIISVWITNDDAIPNDFQWPPKVAPQVEVKIELPVDTSQITIGALVAKHLYTIKGSLSPKQLRAKARWWVARSMANALETPSGVLAYEFGPRMLKVVCLELANTPMDARRHGEKVHRTKSQYRKVISEIKRMFKSAVVNERIAPDLGIAASDISRVFDDDLKIASDTIKAAKGLVKNHEKIGVIYSEYEVTDEKSYFASCNEEREQIVKRLKELNRERAEYTNWVRLHGSHAVTVSRGVKTQRTSDTGVPVFCTS